MNTNLKSFNTALDTGAAVAILVGILATASAIVGESVAARQTVKFLDSNLNTPAGVATLYSNIQSAALRVCTSGQWHLSRPDQVKTCTHEAEDRAIQQINVEALTAYAQMESKTSAPTFAANVAQ
jgi:UrcA family protein